MSDGWQFFASLPEQINEAILQCLDFDEYGAYNAISVSSRIVCAKVIAQTDQLKVHRTSRLARPIKALYKRFAVLKTLDLAEVASDPLLCALSSTLPLLEVLRCARSVSLSDAGLESLFENPTSRTALREVDLTHCRHTSYLVSVQLRKALPSLKLVRRQPAHMDGHFITPFGGSTEERHTYYADGSFDFSRHVQSRGYVRFFEESDEADNLNPGSFLRDSLQYCNFDGANMGWPQFAKFLYRPGVAVRRGKFSCADNSCSGCVLVAQSLQGMHAIRSWPEFPDSEVPHGESVFFDGAYERLRRGMALQEALDTGAVSMISRMKVKPLTSLMPPNSLVNEIEAFERERIDFERGYATADLESAQLRLHCMLGGTPDTDTPW